MFGYTRGLWDLSFSQQGIEPMSSAVKAWSPNHWAKETGFKKNQTELLKIKMHSMKQNFKREISDVTSQINPK